MFIITRELYPKDSVVMFSADIISEYQNALVEILDVLQNFIDNASDADKQALHNFRELIKERTELYKQIENEKLTRTERKQLEQDFQNHIRTRKYGKERLAKIDFENFDEFRARKEWAKWNGVRWDNKNETWVRSNSALYSLFNLSKQIDDFVENSNVGPVVEALRVQKQLLNSLRDKLEADQFGSPSAPIGYRLVNDVYEIDPNYITDINQRLHDLQELQTNMHEDLRKVLGSIISSQIRMLKDFKKKALRNNIAEIMMETITDPNNVSRMITPINFASIITAFRAIPKDLRPSASYDLSSPADGFRAYSSLSSGMILTGAFANAVKVFAYLSQAGQHSSAEPLRQEMAILTEQKQQATLLLNAAKEVLANLPKGSDEAFNQKQVVASLKADLDSVNDKLKENKEAQRSANSIVHAESFIAQLNPKYAFTMKIGDEIIAFDRIRDKDVRGDYFVTETFDTLINAAIDNLKLGYLNKARINTMTGSAMVGMLFLGVPMDVAVKILYQPIFQPLTTGKIYRVEQYLSELKEKFKDLEQNNTILTEEELDKGLRMFDEVTISGSAIENFKSAEAQKLQKKVFDIFVKAHKIGEDVRNTASFLDIIRNLDVFIEDLDQRDTNLENQIGKIEVINDKTVLETRADYAFIAPNLLANTPHVEEAYKTHSALQTTIMRVWGIHSVPIREFAKEVMSEVHLHTDDTIENSSANLADVRRTLSSYLLTAATWSSLNVQPKIVSVDTDKKSFKYIMSPTNVFLDDTANAVLAVKRFAAEHNIKNHFLMSLSESWGNNNGRLSFKGGVNLHSEDIQQIALDFKKLNKFEITKDGDDWVVTYNEDAVANNNLQQRLMQYAVIAFGLKFSSSNFSNYISPSLISEIDTLMETTLAWITQNLTAFSGLIPHFRLSYALSNALRLPYVDKTLVVRDENKRSNGSEEVTISVGNAQAKVRVYYDKKVIRKNNIKHPFIKDGFGARTTVHKLVLETENFLYYQEVGKQKDSSFVNWLRYGNPVYKIQKFFNPLVLSVPYSLKEDNIIYSGVILPENIKVGDEFYIYPRYNYDRMERTRVRLVEELGKQERGFSYLYKVENVPEPVTEQEDEVTPATPLLPPSFATTYISEDLQKDSVTKDEETGKYIVDGVALDAVTGDVIPKFQQRPISKYAALPIGQRMAETKWENLPETEKQLIEGKEMDKAEYAAFVQERHNRIIAKGDIIHLYFHEFFNSGSVADIARQEIAAKMAEFEISDGEMEWLTADAIRKIVTLRTGTNFFDKDGEDRILTELPIKSSMLGMGGTVDMVIDHGNNILSLYDLKSGYGYEKEFQAYLLKYGDTYGKELWDDPRTRAKLQLMLYAVIIKSERPEVKFRNLKVIHIPSEDRMYQDSDKNNVDPAAFLQIIEAFIKDTMPGKHKSLKQSKLFEPSEYMTYDSRAIKPIREGASPSLELKLRILELQSLIMYNKNITERMSSNAVKIDKSKSGERKQRITDLMNEIIELKRNPDIDYKSWDTDMSWMDTWLGTASASTNPYVQLYYSLLTQQKQKARDEYENWRKQFDVLTKKLMAESNAKPFTSLIGGTNRQKLFNFAFKTITKGNTSVTRYVIPSDTEWKSLSDTQKKYLNFVNDSVKQFFDDDKSTYIDPITNKKVALANRVVSYNNRNQPITNINLYNREMRRYGGKNTGFKYYEGFMPKHPPTLSDIIAKNGFLSKEAARFVWNKYMTLYFETEFEGWANTEEAIPMKYLGNKDIDYSGNYSLNLEMSLDAFVKQHFYKQHLDEVYAFGKGLKIYLTEKENSDDKIEFNYLKQWVDDSINLHILGRRQLDNKWVARTPKINSKAGYRKFNGVKFLRSMKTFFTGPTMWLKPITALPNFVFASLVNLKEAVKNSFFLTGSHSNFGVRDLMYGFGVAWNTIVHKGITGTYRDDKAWQLMEKFGYLPDSYDWYTSPNQLLTTRNKLFTSKSMMFFHSFTEEMIATSVFVAQLKSMKFKNAQGQTVSIWDSYQLVDKKLEDGTPYSQVEWVGGERGVRNVSNLIDKPEYEKVEGLTNEEINAIKFLYEKMHGGYRLDERLRAEYYIFGELALQLRKYFPAILKNVYASRGYRNTQGWFTEKTNEDGTVSMQWTPQVIEGRWKMLGGLIVNYVGLRNKMSPNGDKGSKFAQWLGLQNNEAYDLKNFSEVMKDDLWDFGLTTFIFLAMLTGLNFAWDRGDEDTLKKLYMRIQGDVELNVSPFMVLQNLLRLGQPVALTKFVKLITSTGDMLLSSYYYGLGDDANAFTQQGNLRGWKEFQQGFHFLSAYHDIIKALEESNDPDAILVLDKLR